MWGSVRVNKYITRVLPSIIGIVIVATLLILPVFYLLIHDYANFSITNVTLSTLATAGTIWLVYSLLRKLNFSVAVIALVVCIFSAFLVRLSLAITYSFSGRGFTSEFFAHFGLESLAVGLDEYGFLLLIISVVIFLFLILFVKWLSLQGKPVLDFDLFILVFLTFIIPAHYTLMPEWALLSAYNRYTEQIIETENVATIRASTKIILEPLRGVRNLPIEKNEIIIKPIRQEKNVIIIYLESFSEILTQNSDYPSLTPNLDRLKENYFNFKNNYSSGYVTIEGIANSQCGTLMNMDNGNNSLTSPSGRLSHLPCLGDVLQAAGYQQVFYGGADLAFAGKGAFLEEHGYTELMGKNRWLDLGYPLANVWGLSDADLFSEALGKIQKLNKLAKPYNLTLLTLGTHIPGFSYKGCEKYIKLGASDPFLDAIHCTDYLVGKFIDDLKANNLLENTLVYIQGDHAIFSTPHMKKLFGEKAVDKRVLTVIVDQELVGFEALEGLPSSSVNMAANVLDLLGIESNVNFILGKSDFSEVNGKPYIFTRYEDHYGTTKISGLSKPDHCNGNEFLKLPLGYCDKHLALNTIYRLGASYAPRQFTSDYCQNGISISVDSTSKAVEVLWGTKNISKNFYYKGRTFSDIREGFYMLLLDESGELKDQFFFKEGNEFYKLNRELGREGGQFLLFSNLPEESIAKLNVPNLPGYFLKSGFLYAKNTNGKLVSRMDKHYSLGEVRLRPDNCLGGFKVFKHSLKAQIPSSGLEQQANINTGQSKFCDVTTWGPKKAREGRAFNQQANGSSAFWFKTACAPSKAVVRLNGKILKTVRRIPTITAALQLEQLTAGASYKLDLYDPATKKSMVIGNFEYPQEPVSIVFEKKPIREGSKITPPLLLAHAGGGYQNHTYLNSIEAMEFNYNLGHRFFELDFNWTKDNKLVAIHDWEKTYAWLFGESVLSPPTHDYFMGLKMKYKQTQVNLVRLDAWLDEHQDAYIITDIKENNVQALKKIANNMKNGLSNIIPQMYNPNNYVSIREAGFKNVIFTLYVTTLPVEKIINFIENNALIAVTVPPSKPGFLQLINHFKDTSLFLYVHTYNSIPELMKYLNMGVSGVYTDFLYQNDSGRVFKQ